jgi:hypothetical protein
MKKYNVYTHFFSWRFLNPFITLGAAAAAAAAIHAQASTD